MTYKYPEINFWSFIDYNTISVLNYQAKKVDNKKDEYEVPVLDKNYSFAYAELGLSDK